ncbi:MAG: hypothetical protein AXW17_03325 [Colwellia sp. Phe_37]|jgi:hypothetical protein|nr:MAG: hypothetical protein AXW17_03325 [Colwellia sp. Phe_37]
MQDEIKQNADKNTYQNPFAKSQEQRKKLTLPLPKLIELDETFNIVFCCLLAKHIIDTNSLTELKKVLKAVAEYEIVREKDFFLTRTAGFFDHKDKQVFFKETSSGILIGLLNETHYIKTFEQYKYYTLKELITATVDKLIEDVEDF